MAAPEDAGEWVEQAAVGSGELAFFVYYMSSEGLVLITYSADPDKRWRSFYFVLSSNLFDTISVLNMSIGRVCLMGWVSGWKKI